MDCFSLWGREELETTLRVSDFHLAFTYLVFYIICIKLNINMSKTLITLQEMLDKMSEFFNF